MADQRFAPPRLENPDGSVWPTLASPTQGEIGGDRRYSGPTPSIGIWKCPACRAENDGALEAGCSTCGAGAPGKHVGIDPPPAPADHAIEGARRTEGARAGNTSAAFDAVRADLADAMDVQGMALAWVSAHEQAGLAEAFLAGYAFAMARTLRSEAPVTSDVLPVDPTSKARRTIRAALQLFRDQVLTQTPDEIASGEWCSLEECDQLIAELEPER